MRWIVYGVGAVGITIAGLAGCGQQPVGAASATPTHKGWTCWVGERMIPVGQVIPPSVSGSYSLLTNREIGEGPYFWTLVKPDGTRTLASGQVVCDERR